MPVSLLLFNLLFAFSFFVVVIPTRIPHIK